MSDISVRIEGERELRRLLRKMADTEIPKALKVVHLQAAETVAVRARTKVPVRSRRLKDSIRASGQASGAVVRMGNASTPYAGWIDYGGTIRPRGRPIVRPFVRTGRVLYPALRETRPQVVRDYERAIERVLKGMG